MAQFRGDCFCARFIGGNRTTSTAGAKHVVGAFSLLRPRGCPSLVGRLLLGAELTDVAIPVGRVPGIAPIALGVTCWPGRTALCGMLTYNALATLYLAYLGIRGDWVGTLLWPAVVLHAVMMILLGRAWLSHPKPSEPDHHDSA